MSSATTGKNIERDRWRIWKMAEATKELILKYALGVGTGVSLLVAGGMITAWNSFATGPEARRIMQEESAKIREERRKLHAEQALVMRNIQVGIEENNEKLEDAKRQRSAIRKAINDAQAVAHESNTALDWLVREAGGPGMSNRALRPPTPLDADDE